MSRLDARSSRRRIPPEYVRAGRSAASASSKRSSSSAARRRASTRERSNRRPNICRFSRSLRISSTAANCPVSPSSWRTAAASCGCYTSSPKTSARPASGASRVASTRTSVVFLAPFGPSSPATASPPPRGRHPRALSSRRSVAHPRRGRRGRTRGPQPCSGDPLRLALRPGSVRRAVRCHGSPSPQHEDQRDAAGPDGDADRHDHHVLQQHSDRDQDDSQRGEVEPRERRDEGHRGTDDHQDAEDELADAVIEECWARGREKRSSQRISRMSRSTKPWRLPPPPSSSRHQRCGSQTLSRPTRSSARSTVTTSSTRVAPPVGSGAPARSSGRRTGPRCSSRTRR